MRVGIAVYCTICHHQKSPHGRSAPLDGSYCSDDCAGYRQEPLSGCLWPGETEEDFENPVCDNAVKEV